MHSSKPFPPVVPFSGWHNDLAGPTSITPRFDAKGQFRKLSNARSATIAGQGRGLFPVSPTLASQTSHVGQMRERTDHMPATAPDFSHVMLTSFPARTGVAYVLAGTISTSAAGSRPKQEPAGRPLTGVALGDASCAGTHGWVSYGLYKQSCRRRFLGRRIFTKPGPALSARSPFELRDPRR